MIGTTGMRWGIRVIGVAAGALGALALSGCATLSRPAASIPDLPGFQQVDHFFYRGGQPSPDGIRQLHRMGVKTIVSLRHPTNATMQEERVATSLGMRWVRLPMRFWWRPSPEQIREFLALVGDPRSHPVFVHCRKGQNRAGIMTAIYRVARHGWTPEQAYEEGRQLGLVRWNPMTRRILHREIPRLKANRLSRAGDTSPTRTAAASALH